MPPTRWQIWTRAISSSSSFQREVLLAALGGLEEELHGRVTQLHPHPPATGAVVSQSGNRLGHRWRTDLLHVQIEPLPRRDQDANLGRILQDFRDQGQLRLDLCFFLEDVAGESKCSKLSSSNSSVCHEGNPGAAALAERFSRAPPCMRKSRASDPGEDQRVRIKQRGQIDKEYAVEEWVWDS